MVWTVLMVTVGAMLLTSTVIVLALCRAAALGDAGPRPPHAHELPEAEEWRRGA